MMFWRQRDRAVRSEQKAAAMTKDIARPANSGLSAYDFQMQSLKSSLAIYVSETNGYEDEMSTKSNMTHGTEMSMPASMYNDRTPSPTADTDEDDFDPIEHLVIPEGITRLPFRPLPAIFDLVQSIPSHLRSMNYYQRKASRFQPISVPPNSPITTQNHQRKLYPSPIRAAETLPIKLFTTLFGGSVGALSPFSPKLPSALSPSDTVRIRSTVTGIAWADTSSPSAKTGVLNHYQNKFEKNPKVHGSQKRLKGVKTDSGSDGAIQYGAAPIPSGDSNVNQTFQYFHSPRTPFSSPLRQSNGRSISCGPSSTDTGSTSTSTSTPLVTLPSCGLSMRDARHDER